MVQLFCFKKHFSLNDIDAVQMTNDVALWLFDISDPFYRDKENAFKIRKKVLSHYLKSNPKDIHFVKNENGRPQLIEDINPNKLNFNVSHSHDLLGIAVSHTENLGLDVEFIRPVSYKEKIIKKYFTASEHDKIKNDEDFFNFWTAKEASVKSLGGSFFKDVNSLNLDSSQYPKLKFKSKDIFHLNHIILEQELEKHYKIAIISY